MKIFGHPWLNHNPFYKVKNQEEAQNTPANSILRLCELSHSLNLAKYCQKNNISYAIEVKSIKEAIFANLLEAKFIISTKDLATELMPIAQNYLFDTQILAEITQEEEIEEMAKANIDGVIFQS